MLKTAFRLSNEKYKNKYESILGDAGTPSVSKHSASPNDAFNNNITKEASNSNPEHSCSLNFDAESWFDFEEESKAEDILNAGADALKGLKLTDATVNEIYRKVFKSAVCRILPL